MKGNQKGSIIFIVVSIAVIAGFFVLISQNSPSTASDNTAKTETSIDASGKQILNVKAKGGYSPGIINAKANIPAILNVNTSNTYDCSLGFRIPSLNLSRTLPSTGTTQFDIPPQKSGSVISGVCSMGMYSFKIIFN